jgi:hypothetical protein
MLKIPPSVFHVKNHEILRGVSLASFKIFSILIQIKILRGVILKFTTFAP